jgi:hypothetical protein
MTRAREPWNIRPARKPTALSDSIKREVQSKAKKLIDEVLKPKYVQSPKKDQQLNYAIDIGGKWYRNYFYLYSTYACPDPKALSPTFESKFARMKHLGMNRFALSFMRHTGEWVCIYDSLTVDECLRAVQDDPWFLP